MSDEQQLLHWAARYRIAPDALAALAALWPTDPESSTAAAGSEASVVAARRLAASKRGGRLWRNNKGAYRDSRGNYISYGLCNESAAIGKRVRSSDLIGLDPILITPAHVGTVVGQFVAEECKYPGWTYKGDEHERGQLAFLQLVNALGGRGEFVSG